MEEDGAAIGQRPVVEALSSGEATGEVGPLTRIDTAAAHVFLGRCHAFKLKRGRRLPFVDLSTLERRRTACEAELAANHALAAGLYEAVEPVVRTASGAIRVGGEGQVVDWVVRMRRFADGALFQELAERGALTDSMVREICDTLAGFHARLAPQPGVGHVADYRRIITGLRVMEGEAAGALGLAPASETLFQSLDRAVLRCAPDIEARRRQGWVRHGHGDLHLANICLFEGRAVAFDALEFDPALATTDVLYDFAFLVMDLRAMGLDALANEAMNRYLDASRSPPEALRLLPVFMALRAGVRMAVSLGQGALSKASAYRALARELLLPRPCRLVAIGGLSGSGKSTAARRVAARLEGCCGARLLRTDVLRKADGEASGPGGRYAPTARSAIYRALAAEASAVLRAGSSVVADATFQEGEVRRLIQAAAPENRFAGLWLRAAPAVRAKRVARRRNDASEATPAVALAQREPSDLGAGWRVIDAEGSMEDIEAQVLGALLA